MKLIYVVGAGCTGPTSNPYKGEPALKVTVTVTVASEAEGQNAARREFRRLHGHTHAIRYVELSNK
jgi:hypothetical protein